MCCIFGIGLFKDSTFRETEKLSKMIASLFLSGSVLGSHASGLAIADRNKIGVLRRPLSPYELCNSKEYENFLHKYLHTKDNEPMIIFGHCRFPTKGSVKVHYNNHPIVTDDIVGIHNGEIINDNALFRIFSKDIKRIGTVDTEIIFRLIQFFSTTAEDTEEDNKITYSIKRVSRLLSGSYACGLLSAIAPANLYLFRHISPIYIHYLKSVSMIVFASRDDFVTSATFQIPGNSTRIEIPNNTGIVLNLEEKKAHAFRTYC